MSGKGLEPLIPLLSYPNYIVTALKKAKLSIRKYQEIACCKSITFIREGKNVEINLPPGTGKTLISQIISIIWLKESDDKTKKSLFILPSTNLLQQHADYCFLWAGLSGLCNVISINSEFIKNKRIDHQMAISESNMIFSMPKILYNSIQNGYFTESDLHQIGLVVVDEYDALSIGILTSYGIVIKFNKSYEKLMDILNNIDSKYVLLSATPN